MFERLFQKKEKRHQGFPEYFSRVEDIDLSPLFVLGGNRSGTSLITAIVAQHSQLEGIFPEPKKSFPTPEPSGHVTKP